MDLSELTPEVVEFNLRVPMDQENILDFKVVFRPFSVADEQWVNRTYSKEELALVFQKLEMENISKIAFRMLTLETKQRLMKIVFEDMDEAGNPIMINETGPEKFCALIVGVHNISIVLESIVKCRGFSMPVMEKMVIDAGKLQAQNKKPIGQ